jgi:putative ABC transport system permease protein
MNRDLVRDLHAATRSITSGRKLRKTLVIAEVALSFVLVAAAGLMARSFIRLARVDAGFRPEHVLTVRMLLLPVRDEAFHAEVVRDILQRIRSLPGVTAAGSIGVLPMQGTNSGTWYYRADGPEPPPNNRPAGDVSIITPGYFRSLGIAILRGRDFNEYDRQGSPQVAILNQTAAKMLFPNEDPLGKRVRVWWNHSPIVEVVAVAADIRHSQLNSAPDPCLFMPNDQQPFPFSSLVVRTTGDPAKLATAVRQQIRQVDRDQGVANVETMQQLVVDSIARPRFETLLLCAFAFIALALACVGIYGVVAYSVTRRSREIGIRIALGASRFSVFRIVLSDGFGMTIFGLLAGLGATLVLTRFLRSLLFEIRPDDPITLAAVTVTLACVSLLACYFPARRAMSVDPAMTLREE